MDYVKVNPNLPLDDRDQISGVRVLDGEDQGNYLKFLYINNTFISIFQTETNFL